MVIMENGSENDDAMYGGLVISCTSSPPEDLIKLILETEKLPEPKCLHNIVSAYPWHIETKYYHADIHLFTTTGKDLVNEGFAESVQAVVIYLDNKCTEKFEEVKSWLPFLEHYEADVQILVCDNCSNENLESSIKKPFLLDWCLKNNYELVELKPDELSDDEGEDDFKETTGYRRIIQALHAHLWPNMEMKENPSINSTARLEKLLQSHDEAIVNNEEDKCESNPDESDKVMLATAQENNDDNHLLEKLDADRFCQRLLQADEPHSFEHLFGQFQDMKEKASTLQGEDRKQYAEKVAIAFWRAMGGDEDEIAGLSSDEDK